MIGIILQQGIKEIVAHKGKSFLTMLGVMIGVMSVILINGVGTGAQNLFLNQITTSGTNLISVLPGRSDEAGGPPAAAQGIVITTLTADDAIALENNSALPHVLYSGVYVRGSGTLSYLNRNVTVTFAGTRANKNDIEDAAVQSGRPVALDLRPAVVRLRLDRRQLGHVLECAGECVVGGSRFLALRHEPAELLHGQFPANERPDDDS